MGFPQVPTTSSGKDITGDTSIVVTLPSGIVSGDLVVVFIGQNNSTSTFTWPGSWEKITDANRTAISKTIGYLIASGGETTVTVTSTQTGGSGYAALRIDNWHGTTPPEAATIAEGNSTNPDPPSPTPSWGADDTLWLASTGNGGTNNGPSSYPTNYTVEDEHTNPGGDARVISVASRELNASSDDPDTFTIDSSNWIAQTVAIRPVAAAIADFSPVDQLRQSGGMIGQSWE